MDLRYLIGGTDQGLVRASNQDRFETVKLSDTLAFAVLCDGMGGENGGGVASEIGARHVREALSRGLTEGLAETSLRALMQSAVSGANALIYDAAQKDPKLSGMGTTMIIAVFRSDMLYVCNVGDSRVYIISPDGERQLSRDHTVVQMLVDLGEISPEDARIHPKRHFITRAVGVGPAVEADFIAEALGETDIVLLCSDGLYSYLEPGSFYELLRRCVEENSVELLIDLAKEAGGADNITAVVAN